MTVLDKNITSLFYLEFTIGARMLRHSLIVFTVLMSVSSVTFAADFQIPKPVRIQLVEEHCSLPKPNPRVSADLEYDCSDKYEDSDGKEQSMNYSLRLLPLIKEDFNKDGIQDIAVEVESMGPLGGSVFTNSAVHYLLLDTQKRIIGEHLILLYAPFSDHIVEYKTRDKQIDYSAIPNYRSNTEAYDDGELIEPAIDFSVYWVGSTPVSSYYRDNCALATNTNKQVFKKSSASERFETIDIHDYTQVVEENIKIADMQVSATLKGCDTMDVSLNIMPLKGHTLPVLAEVLKALIAVAYNDEPFNSLLELDKQSLIVFGKVMALEDNGSGQIHINRSGKTPTIVINLSRDQ